MRVLLLIGAGAVLAAGQVVNGGRTYLGVQDAGKAQGSRMVTGYGPPAGGACNDAKAITNASNASPIVITSNAHGYTNGQVVTIYGVGGNQAANGTWVVGNATASGFALCGNWDGACQAPASGSGAYTAGGFASAHVGREYFRTDIAAGQNKYYCADTAGTPSWSQPPQPQQQQAGGYTLGCAFDGGGAAVTPGSVCYTRATYSCAIAEWSVVAGGSSPTATIDVWKTGAGTALPTASIAASAKPALASGNAARSAVLTGWTTAVTAYDLLGFRVDAATNATTLEIKLRCQ